MAPPPKGSRPKLGWSSREFADLIGVNQNTVFRWHSTGTLVGASYPSGRRYYTVEHLLIAVGRSIQVPLDSDYQAFVVGRLASTMARGLDARLALDEIDRDWRAQGSLSASPSPAVVVPSTGPN